MSDFDAIVVGAGPAGSCAAIVLARAGKRVALIERGPFPGSKNMYGGVIYPRILDELIPEWWLHAPIQRWITRRSTMIMTEPQALNVDFRTQAWGHPPYNGATAYRPDFDHWLADVAVEAGTTLICSTTVTGLLHDANGRISGVTTDRPDGDLTAPIVIACDGVNSFLAKQEGLYGAVDADNYTLGVKETLSLPKHVIDERFGVRGIPSVKAFVGGELVDEFSGALPEAEVRAFLERIIPSPAETQRLDALAHYAATGDAKQALAMLAEASRLDPQHEIIRVDSAGLLIDLKEHDEARRLLDSLSPLAQMDDHVKTLYAKLALTTNGESDANTQELLQRIAADSKDSDARLRLARQYIALGQYGEALDQLLEIVRRDRKYKDDGARKTMLQVFSVLGNDNPLVGEYRRKLAGALN